MDILKSRTLVMAARISANTSSAMGDEKSMPPTSAAKVGWISLTVICLKTSLIAISGRVFLTVIDKERDECNIYYRVRPVAWHSYILALPTVDESVYSR